LAELVAALSLGIDLGFGQPMEHVLRQCLIALRLAERLSLDEQQRAVVYYTALLVNVGCHADAHEQAKWFGDDIALKAGKYRHELRSVRTAAASMRLVGSGNPPLHRFRVGLEFAFSGHREMDDVISSHAAMARALAEQLGLPDAVLAALGGSYEQWDGRGWPGELAGADVPIAARLAQLAEFVEVAHRVGGVPAATALARKRGGRQFDPALADLLCAEADTILAGLDSVGTWEAVIEAEPALAVVLSAERFDAALLAIATFVDLKSPYTLGHARAVADLAAQAGARLGASESAVRTLRRAGLVHDLGRLGVSNSIWDKRGPLGAGEWERVRIHPYLTERMLHQSEALAPLGAIAVQHRERLDGSGYPRGLACDELDTSTRILAVCDVYDALVSDRVYRPAWPQGRAIALLRDPAQFDQECVAALERLIAPSFVADIAAPAPAPLPRLLPAPRRA
jgi:HD-GYP domain-containing protein (c-di-GMP phosphodiesterase class II)